jgi:hypothetical protein
LEIIVFILLAGVWAAFLLPSFFDSRRHTPRAATRDFARSTAMLASVSAQPYGALHAKRQAAIRRRNSLVGLGIAAASTLAVAVWTGSVFWLGVTIACDVLIGLYVTLMLQNQQAAIARAQVVRIPRAPRQADHEVVEPEVADAPPTVRVIAG